MGVGTSLTPALLIPHGALFPSLFLQKWPMRSRLYMGSLDTTTASIRGPRTEALPHTSAPSPALGDQ